MNQRTCLHCHAPLPPSTRKNASPYCDQKCRSAHAYEQVKVEQPKEEEITTQGANTYMLKEELSITVEELREVRRETFEEADLDLLASLKGQDKLNRKLQRAQGETPPKDLLISNYRALFEELPERAELYALCMKEVDERNHKYPQTVDFIIHNIKLPKLLVERGLLLKESPSGIVPNVVTQNKIDSKQIWGALNILSHLKKDVDSLISKANGEREQQEKALCDAQHELFLLGTTEEEVLKLGLEMKEILQIRSQAKNLSQALEVVKELKFGELFDKYSKYGSVYNSRFKGIQFTDGELYADVMGRVKSEEVVVEKVDIDGWGCKIVEDTKGTTGEEQILIQKLHESAVSKHVAKSFPFKKGELQKLVDANQKYRAFRVVGNMLNCYN